MIVFELASEPIDVIKLRGLFTDPGVGAFVTFEGWVRDHNEGRAVSGLHYEAYEALAIREGNTIIAEALQLFDIRTARCQHRMGALAIGGIAVWVGAGSDHRDAAFKACRYIIDEVKARVPIWKKEIYVDGDTEWIDCRDSQVASQENPAKKNPV